MSVDWLLKKLEIEWVPDDGDFVESTEAFIRRKHFVLLADNKTVPLKYRCGYYFEERFIKPWMPHISRMAKRMPKDVFVGLVHSYIERFALSKIENDVARHLATIVYGHAVIEHYDPTDNPVQLIRVTGNGLVGDLFRARTQFVRRSQILDLIHSRSVRNDAYASSPDGG